MSKHIALIHFRVSMSGGLETRLFNYLPAFLERGYKVSLLTARIAKNISLPKGVELIHLSYGKTPKLMHLRQWSFARQVREHLANHPYDHSFSLGRTFGQQVVLAAGNHKGYLRNQGKRGIFPDDWVQIHLDQQSFNDAEVILAASKMMKHELTHLYGVQETKIHLLYPPLDTKKFHIHIRKKRMDFRTTFGFTDDKLHFVFVSTGHARKGLGLLMRVFAKLDPTRYQLWVAGSGQPTHITPLPHVHFLGFVQQTQELYAAADALVHPALYEPFGQVVSEAIACGLPVLISSHTGAKEIVQDQNGIVIPNLDVPTWLEEIHSFSPTTFSPSPEVINTHQLSVEQHVDRMLEWF